MKIGIYCTNNFTYPVPNGTIYASITVAGNLADRLSNLGHDVTLFAPIGTKTHAKLVTFDMLPFSDPQIYKAFPNPGSSYEYEKIMLTQSLNFAEENKFDVFHTHCRPLSIVSYAALKPHLPIVATIHDPLIDDAFKILPEFNRFKNLHFVALSEDQKSTCPNINWAGVVNNGIDPTNWPFNPNPKDYLLFVGRIMPEKGANIAVQVAKTLNLPLRLYGSIYDHHKSFFEEKISPFLNEKIQYFGTSPQNELPEIYGNAQALLMPTSWHEPFGLVAIESMSTGTPVIALDNGSMKEIIVDQKTGFLVKTQNDLTTAVGKIPLIERAACRKLVEEKFSLEVTAENYLRVYDRVLKS